MTGTVLVAHNLDFEDGFLNAAARRAGISLPRVVGVCTLQTARRQLDGRAFSPISMYKQRQEVGRTSTPPGATPAQFEKCSYGCCATRRHRSTSHSRRQQRCRLPSNNAPSTAARFR